MFTVGGLIHTDSQELELIKKNRPQLISALPVKVNSIAADFQHSLVLLENGIVYGWGRNEERQLGGGPSQPILFPKNICTMDKRILLASFGKGGKVLGFRELEQYLRYQLSHEVSL